MVDGLVVLDDGVSCGGFRTDHGSFGAFLCIGSRIFCDFLFASCAHDVNRVAGLEINMCAAGNWRFVLPHVGFVYQLGKSGWFSSTTSSGGLLTLLGDSSFGGWGLVGGDSWRRRQIPQCLVMCFGRVIQCS